MSNVDLYGMKINKMKFGSKSQELLTIREISFLENIDGLALDFFAKKNNFRLISRYNHRYLCIRKNSLYTSNKKKMAIKKSTIKSAKL